MHQKTSPRLLATKFRPLLQPSDRTPQNICVTRVLSRRKSEIKRPSDKFLGRPRHSDEPTWFNSQMLSVTQTEATKRETLGKPDRPRDDQSLVRGGGFHLGKFASNPTRVGLSNRCQFEEPPN